LIQPFLTAIGAQLVEDGRGGDPPQEDQIG
jgi:hypothetical protein